MKNSKTGIFSLVLLLAWGGNTVYAQSPAPKEGYQYPELLVVPKASQRLTALANQENKTRFRTHFVLQAPAFFTLLAGASAMSMKEAQSKEAAAIASGIGLGWILGTMAMSAMYTPYRTGQQEIAALGDKTLEQTLAKERRAEEALYFPAYLMRRVQYISAFTNFAGAIAITSLVEENDKVKAVAGVAAVMAFLPLVFDHPWITNYDQQQDYKKRIYGPVVEFTLLGPGSESGWGMGSELPRLPGKSRGLAVERELNLQGQRSVQGQRNGGSQSNFEQRSGGSQSSFEQRSGGSQSSFARQLNAMPSLAVSFRF